MIKALLIPGLLCWHLVATAQVRQVKGMVTFDNNRQGNAVIKNRNIQALSNDLGEFSVQAKSGDTLITIKEGFLNDTLTITDVPYFIIRLRKSPLMLKEVDINGTLLTPEKKLAENKAAYKEIYRKGDKSNAIVITPLGVGVVIDKVWSAVSKEGHDARRLQRTFVADYQNSIVDRRFSKALVSQVTGYSGELLFNFMSKYRPDYDIVKNATDYEVIRYIKKCLKGRKPKAIVNSR
jgi:hypothetical protein